MKQTKIISEITNYLKSLNQKFEIIETEEKTGLKLEIPILFENYEEPQELIFSLFITDVTDDFNDTFVRFVIVPLVDAEWLSRESVWKEIAELNHQIPSLKIALDPDGDLELICDIYFDFFNKNYFMKVMQSLVDYTKNYFLYFTSELIDETVPK